MDAEHRAAQRARLEGWIADSLRRRRRITQALLPLVAISIVITVFARSAGLIALVIAVAIVGTGFWITTAHVSDMRGRIRDLEDSGPRKVFRKR
ncbi:MAG TPA: hypothetical protein VHE35_31380 [Kofleriaceae bacterium]|nr:hypothetical protein [Kofleriaceae bacterium]